MAGGTDSLWQFKDAMVFLAAAGVGVPLLQRLKVNPIVGFMLAGMAIGPYGLEAHFASQAGWLRYLTIDDPHGFASLGELGVIFLLFTIGLDLSFARLWTLRRLVFGLGSAQVVVTALALGGALFVVGIPIWAAVVAGLGLALSSTAVALQLLISRHRFGTPEGQTAFAILLMQDLMVVPILFLVGALSMPHGADMTAAILNQIGWGTISVVALLLIGRFVVPPIMRAAARSGSHELFIAVVLLVALAAAMLTGLSGLPTSLGAFLAGAVLAEGAFKHQVEADIEPFKGLLLGLFFVNVGMSIDLEYVWSNIDLILIGLGVLVGIKALVLLVLSPVFRVPLTTGLQVSFLLAQGGEFALILLAAAAQAEFFDNSLAQVLTAIVVMSMAITPLMDELGRRIARLSEWRRAERPKLQTADRDGPLIIGGFGRVGKTVAAVLDAEDLPWLALDADPSVVSRARKQNLPVFYGDSARKDVLQRAGANRAPAFVVTLSSAQAAERMVRAVREEWPEAKLVARAKDWKHADHLRRIGVDDVVPEAVEGSLQLAAHVLESMGLEEASVSARIDEERERAKTSHEDD